MQNAEKESDHRREMEKTVLSGEIRDNAAQIAAFARGQWLGFFLGFLVLVVAGYALFQHETIIGSIGLGTTLVLVIGAFYPKKHIDSSGQQDDAVPTAPSQNDKITLPKKERRRG